MAVTEGPGVRYVQTFLVKGTKVGEFRLFDSGRTLRGEQIVNVEVAPGEGWYITVVGSGAVPTRDREV